MINLTGLFHSPWIYLCSKENKWENCKYVTTWSWLSKTEVPVWYFMIALRASLKTLNFCLEDTWSYFYTEAFSLSTGILKLLCSSVWGVRIPLPCSTPNLFFLSENPCVRKKSWTKSVRVTHAGQDSVDKCFCAACAATANSANALGKHLPN